MKKILISGGTGLLGSHLIPMLRSEKYATAVLSRRPTLETQGLFHWDPEKGEFDKAALQNCSVIIHLAGMGIADKPWTAARKQEILDSRVKSAQLLQKVLSEENHSVKTIISASAIGVYGDAGDEWVDEKSEIKNGFLQETCMAWENSVKRFEQMGIRVVILRIGIVLAKEGGAFPQMALPVKLFAGAPLGSGKQFISWIHINDLCRMFMYALGNPGIQGTFNAVAPSPVRNKDFYKILSEKLHRPLWPFSVPSFIMKLILGARAQLVLGGQRVSNKKISEQGFSFQFTEADKAIEDLVKS